MEGDPLEEYFDKHTICHDCGLIIPWLDSEAFPSGDVAHRGRMTYRARLCLPCGADRFEAVLETC